MQLCLSERMTLGAWMFVHDRLTPTTAVALSRPCARRDYRLRALAAIIVAKPAGSQAGTALRGLPARKGHDNNRGDQTFFSYRHCYHRGG
jgi:hypothetical protein